MKEVLRDVVLTETSVPMRLILYGPSGYDRLGKARLGYQLLRGTAGEVLFEGEDFSPGAMMALDGDKAILSLLSFLTLKLGDTDDEYFQNYSPAQLAWTESTDCEELALRVSLAEEGSEILPWSDES